MTLLCRGGDAIQTKKTSVAIRHRFDGLGADFRIGIIKKRGEGLVLCRLATNELSDAPDRMNPRKLRGGDFRRDGCGGWSRASPCGAARW